MENYITIINISIILHITNMYVCIYICIYYGNIVATYVHMDLFSIYKYFSRSVLFSGQIERSYFNLFKPNDRSIFVAINTNGLHVIRKTAPPVRKCVTVFILTTCDKLIFYTKSMYVHNWPYMYVII